MTLVVITFRSMCARPSIWYRLMDRSVVFLMVVPKMYTSTCAPGTPTLNIKTPQRMIERRSSSNIDDVIDDEEGAGTFSGFPGFIRVGGLKLVEMLIPALPLSTGTVPSILQEAITNPLTAYTRTACFFGRIKPNP